MTTEFTNILEPAKMAEDNREPTSERTKQIAKRLKKIREARAIGQRALARQLGISPSLMNHYERGERRIPSDVLAVMAEILECSTDVLMGVSK